jgi:hypothetical protein
MGCNFSEIGKYEDSKKENNTENEEYFINNGLLGIKRDVFLLLIRYMYYRSDDIIKNVC